MSSTTNVLVTGANRGIGKGLLRAYVARPNTVVIAGVRDPASASSKALNDVAKGSGSSVIIVKLDSISETDAKAAVKQIQTEQGIEHLDTVIANAGIANYWGPTATTPISEFQSHFAVNTLGVVILFQAVLPLLEKSKNPKFVPISSTVGSIGDMEKYPLPGVAYGASKTAVNYISRKIHSEHEELTVFPVHPGWVQTDMGNGGAVAVGMEEAPTTLEDSVDGIVDKIDNATREKTSGNFVTFDGTAVGW